MSLFPSSPSRGKGPQSHREYWNSLKRDPKFEYPYEHQGKIIEKYKEIPASVRDVAICLPTGTGKTATVLWIAGFALSQKRQRVLYLCPNTQLASQVLDEARQLGIPAVALWGRWTEIPLADREDYQAGEAIGIASYWTLFNSNPATGKPSLIIFDDVHAAGDSTLSPWQLEIERGEDPEVFEAVQSILRKQIPAAQITALQSKPPPGTDVELVRTRDWLLVADVIEAVLRAKAPSSRKLSNPWKGVAGHLDVCFCFLAPDTITIRPWAPPAFDLPDFNEAERRLYISATLDQWGHLEDVMGVDEVERVTQEDVPVPGRRLILNLNRLLENMEDIDRVVYMAKQTDKAVILTRTNADRNDVIERLKNAGYEGSLLGTDPKVERDVTSFREAKSAALVLANRYDGLDLGRDLCQNLIIWKLPLAIGTQEEFTTAVWKMRDAAEARARHRIQQGLGRCTRRNADAVVVGLVGEDLLEFVHRPHIRAALPRRIQAELRMSQRITDPGQFEAYVEACVNRTNEWDAAVRSMEEDAATLSESAPRDEEVAKVHRKKARYNLLLWQRSFDGAAVLAHRAAQELERRPEAAAIWYYLSSAARDLQHYARMGSPLSPEGSALLKEASHRAAGRPWFGQLADLADQSTTASVNEDQVDGLARFLARFPPQTEKLDEAFKGALSGLSAPDHGPYHNGLEVLGHSLGFDVLRPKRDGAPDNVWALGNAAVAIWEAKTEKVQPTSELAMKDIAQIVAHPRDVRANEGLVVSDHLRTTVITPSIRGAKEREHEFVNFDIVTPRDVEKFARAWFGRISNLHKRTGFNPSDPQHRPLLASLLKQHQATAPQILATLQATRASERLQAV